MSGWHRQGAKVSSLLKLFADGFSLLLSTLRLLIRNGVIVEIKLGSHFVLKCKWTHVMNIEMIVHRPLHFSNSCIMMLGLWELILKIGSWRIFGANCKICVPKFRLHFTALLWEIWGTITLEMHLDFANVKSFWSQRAFEKSLKILKTLWQWIFVIVVDFASAYS